MISYKIKRHQFSPWRCEHNGYSETFTVDVSQINTENIEYFMRRMKENLRIPPRYLENTDELV